MEWTNISAVISIVVLVRIILLQGTPELDEEEKLRKNSLPLIIIRQLYLPISPIYASPAF